MSVWSEIFDASHLMNWNPEGTKVDVCFLPCSGRLVHVIFVLSSVLCYDFGCDYTGLWTSKLSCKLTFPGCTSLASPLPQTHFASSYRNRDSFKAPSLVKVSWFSKFDWATASGSAKTQNHRSRIAGHAFNRSEPSLCTEASCRSSFAYLWSTYWCL